MVIIPFLVTTALNLFLSLSLKHTKSLWETMGRLKFMPGFQHRVIFLTILPWFLFADGGAADFNHVMIGISDPQVRKGL